jgi:hypothetical protein
MVAVVLEADGRSRGARFLSVVLTVLLLGFLALAFLLLAVPFVASYPRAKAVLDSFVAALGVPGTAGGYLTKEADDRFLEHLPIAAGAFAICGVTLALSKRKLARFLRDIPSEWRGMENPFRIPFHGGTETALEIGTVLVLFAAGIFVRVWHLGRVVRYDEAWTYVDFASRPLLSGLSNYAAPNNHLLNTLLVHLSTKLLGNTLFGLRFPAFIAGCLVIPVSWVVARTLYGQAAGILTAGCVAALPTFIEFSVNARGYALQWLFILAVVWFAAKLQENPSSRIAWLGFVVAAVAGTYAIPTTLIAVAGVFGWMLVSTLVDREAGKLKSVSIGVALAGVAIALLSLLLYLPPLVDRGPAAVVAKEVVTWQRHDDFLRGFAFMAECARLRWTEGVPQLALWILLAGLVAGLVFFRRFRKHSVSMTIALWLSAAIFAWALHVFGFPRVWSYLLLSAVMTASAGLSLVLKPLAGLSPIRGITLAAAASVALTMVMIAGVIKQRALFTSNETGTIIDADQIVDFLSAELRPGDSLLSNAIINYDLLRRDPKLYGSLDKTRKAARVMAVVPKKTGSTELCRTEELVPLLAARDSADPASLAQQIDLNDYTPPQIQAKFLTSTVYSLERREKKAEAHNTDSSPVP